MNRGFRERRGEASGKGRRIGGAMGIRTPDLLIANETLYQLSYDPIHRDADGGNYVTKNNVGKRKERFAVASPYLTPPHGVRVRR